MTPDPDPPRWWTAFHTTWLAALVIGSTFTAGSRDVLTRAFGPAPMGVPVLAWAVAAELVLLLPAPYFIWHGTRVGFATRHVRGAVWARVLWLDRERPEYRPSLHRALGGVAYFAAIVVAWITFTHLKKL